MVYPQKSSNSFDAMMQQAVMKLPVNDTPCAQCFVAKVRWGIGVQQQQQLFHDSFAWCCAARKFLFKQVSQLRCLPWYLIVRCASRDWCLPCRNCTLQLNELQISPWFSTVISTTPSTGVARYRMGRWNNLPKGVWCWARSQTQFLPSWSGNACSIQQYCSDPINSQWIYGSEIQAPSKSAFQWPRSKVVQQMLWSPGKNNNMPSVASYRWSIHFRKDEVDFWLFWAANCS